MTTVPDAGNGVVITLADIYKQMVTLTTRVDTSLTRQDRADQIIAEHEADLRPLSNAAQQLADHEARLRSIERGRWPLTSITILIALASLAVAVAVALTRH
jgi:hypothetical protein